MHVARKKLGSLSVLIGNALQPSTRGYAVQRSIPVTWVRPTSPSCYSKEKSGDGGLELDIKPEDYVMDVQGAKELEDANEIVKKLASIEFNGGKVMQLHENSKAISMVNRHKNDRGSIEARAAYMTVRILRLQKYLEKDPYDKKAKTVCKELIERRQKMLKKLRERDYPCFEYLLERLNLIFHPNIRPEHYHRVERKWGTKMLLQKHCDKVVEDKLDTYRKSLEAQQKDFFKEKAEKLEFMRSEEIACGVEPTVTEEEIEAAKQKAASFA